MNELNQEILGDVLAAVVASFSVRLGVKDEELNFSDKVTVLAKDDEHLFSHALMDIHEMLGLELNYMPLTEFEKFETVSSVAEYFYTELEKIRG